MLYTGILGFACVSVHFFFKSYLYQEKLEEHFRFHLSYLEMKISLQGSLVSLHLLTPTFSLCVVIFNDSPHALDRSCLVFTWYLWWVMCEVAGQSICRHSRCASECGSRRDKCLNCRTKKDDNSCTWEWAPADLARARMESNGRGRVILVCLGNDHSFFLSMGIKIRSEGDWKEIIQLAL